MHPSKIGNKDYNRWLADEIDDYYCQPSECFPQNHIFKYETTLDYLPQDKLDDKDQIPNTTFKQNKSIKCPPHFDFDIWEKLPLSVLHSLALYLSLKDIINMICSCKGLAHLLDTEDMWKVIKLRDAKKLRMDPHDFGLKPSKQAYRYLMYRTMTDLEFYTGYRDLKETAPAALELMRSLVDLISLKNPSLALIVHELIRFDNPTKKKKLAWPTDLKISWLKQKNEIHLWIGRLGSVKKSKTVNHLTKTFNYDVLVPKVLRQYRFRKEEQICSTFFLDHRYLVIEVKEEEKEEEHNSFVVNENHETNLEIEQIEDKGKVSEESKKKGVKHSFTIIDLTKEIKSKTDDLSYYSPFKCAYINNNEIERKIREVSQEELVYELDFQEDVYENKSNISVKAVNEEELIFFTKKTKKPIFCVFNQNIKEKIFDFTVELDKKIVDVVLPKKISRYSEIKLFIIDEDATVYCVNYSPSSELNVKKIPLQVNEEEQKHNSHKDETFSRFDKYDRMFYHGVYSYMKDIKAQETVHIEYLVVNKSQSFNIINLESLHVHHHSFDDSGTSIQGKIVAWDIYSHKLCILAEKGFFVFPSSIFQPDFTRFERRVLSGWKSSSLCKHWLCIGPCYSLMAGSSSVNYRDDIEISIFPTFKLLSRVSNAKNLYPYNFSVENIFDPDAIRDKSIPITQEQLKIKLEDNVIFIKSVSGKYGFFCDLEAHRSFTEANGITNVKSIDLNVLNEQEEQKVVSEQKPKERIRIVTYMKPVENLNRQSIPEIPIGNATKKNNSSNRKPKNPALENKGPKYHKNIRQAKHLDKRMSE